MPRSASGGGGSSKKKRKPSATQRARSQEQQFRSQGRAVERAANRQRREVRTRQQPSRRPVAFRPIRQTNEPFRVERQRARRTHGRAERRVGDDPTIPRIPLKKVYNEAERAAIIRTYKRAAERAGADNILGLYERGSTRQRREMSLVSRRLRESPQREFNRLPAFYRGAFSHWSVNPERAPNVEYRSPEEREYGGILKVASIVLPGQILRVNPKDPSSPLVRNVAEAPVQFARAIAEEPSMTAKSSLRTAKESLAGIPQGLKMVASAVEEAAGGNFNEAKNLLSQIADDYERRYGPIAEGDWETFRERIQTDYGVTPYAFDALMVTPGVGQTLGLGARTAAFGKLTSLPGRTGRIAKALHEATQTEVARPRLRFGAGEGGTRAQRVSGNLFTALGQRKLDRSRSRRYTKSVEGAGFRELPTGEMVRTRSGAVPDRLPGLRPGPGEVVGRGLRDVGPLRGLTGRVQRDIGQTKSTTRIRMLTHRGRVMNEINKAIDPLSEAEQVGLAFMLRLGVRPGEKGAQALRKRLDDIETPEARKAREEGGFDDMESQTIRAILDDPDAYLTPQARNAAGQLKAIQKREASRDPSLDPRQELLRRYAQQAEFLGVQGRRTRKGELAPDVTQMERLLNMLEDSAEQQRKLGVKGSGMAPIQQQANALRQKIEDIKKGADPDIERRAGGFQAGMTVRSLDRGNTGKIVSVEGDSARVRFVNRKDGTEATVTLPLSSLRRAGKADVSGAGMAQAVARTYMGPERREGGGDVDQFIQRVQDAAREAGLDEPAYWMSVADPASGARYAATGSGLKATERNKAYTGALFRIGAEDVGLENFVRGAERNIKRRFQWQMVTRNIETYAYEWSRNGGQGLTRSQMINEMRKRRIDPDTTDMIPATIVRKREEMEEGIARGRPIDEVPDGEEMLEINDELRQRISFDQLAADEVQGAPMMRYFAVQKEVTEVLDASTRPASGAMRAFEIIMKQKPTRIMLGALNIPWLGFQVASNAMLTGLGGGLKPWDIYGAHKWFKGLDPDVRNAIEAELGITHGHHFALDQPHLGDAKLPPGVQHLTNFYRGYKQTKVGRGLHKANPLDFMFRLDEAQNNFFRKTLFYSQAKKSAYGRMGRNWRGVETTQGSIIEKVFSKPADQQLKLLSKHGELFEAHAKHVRDWLGDYTRFSPAERKLLQANVLFYGYLRFSLRFAFYTMPVQHPVMMNILGNIGRMGAQEIKELFGVPSNYNLPTSMLAQVYFGERKDAKKGTLESVNYGRMNPFLNTLTQLESEQQAIGLVSPIYQALADQAFEESSFTGREWRIEGRPTPGEATRPKNYFGSALNLLNPGAYSIPGVSEGKPRNRILQASLLRMAFPYRVAGETGIPGVVDPMAESQSDDALLWEQRPMRYKDEEAMRGVRRSRRTARETPFGEKLLSQIIPPLVPRVTAAPQVIERELEKEADMRNQRTGKKKRRRKKNRYGGGSGSRYGGSSSGSNYGG